MTTLTVGALTKASWATHGNAMSTKSMSFFTVRLLLVVSPSWWRTGFSSMAASLFLDDFSVITTSLDIPNL